MINLAIRQRRCAIRNEFSLSWTPELVERLKALFRDGLSGSQIAAVLGCTRNAAIGKIHRLGLSGGGRKTGGQEIKKEKPPKRVRRDRGYVGLKEKLAPWLPGEPAAPPEMKNCSILELGTRTCRFPIGDPQDKDFCFCGNDTAGDGVVYCDHHARIAYTSQAEYRANRPANTEYRYYGTKS